MVNLTATQKDILTASGPLLIRGGPGSGKTTIAILKAADFASTLRPAQSILFLSFARATVARIFEAIEQEKMPPEVSGRIEVDTYHAFFWRVLRTHGYLVGLPRRLLLMTPSAEAIALSAIRRNYKPNSKLSERERIAKQRSEEAERLRLAQQEGRVCFDTFAHFTSRLVRGSRKIRSLIATAFPIIILDEFQDTNSDQWSVLKSIGKHNTLIALADPEQRIFEFAGAEEKRIQQFRDTFHPKDFDLESDNHRSPGTDIAKFGNDILKGHFSQRKYSGIQYVGFEPNPNQAFAALRGQALQARQRRLKANKKNWTVAVLVPTRRMARQVSEALQKPTATMPSIPHSAVIDMEGPILAAEAIAYLLQQDGHDGLKNCVDLVCAFYRGCGGDEPGRENLSEADRIQKAYQKCKEKEAIGKPWPANSVIHAIGETFGQVSSLALSGDPEKDWTAVRTTLESSKCPRFRQIAEEVRGARLLERGMALRQSLALDWRSNGKYSNALAIIRKAFVLDHFATAGRPERGVVIMNMHKAKGKQFDEVIIFEGWPRFNGPKIVSNPDKIVRNNIAGASISQDRQNLRVSITRARIQTTILTPKGDPCVLFVAKDNQ